MSYATPIIAAVAAVAGAGVGAYSAVESSKASARSLRAQKTAQQQAAAAAIDQRRSAAEATKKARSRQPDILALLASNQGTKRAATDLTGGALGLIGGQTKIGQ